MVEKCGVEDFMLGVEKSGVETCCNFLSLIKNLYPKYAHSLKIDLINLKMILSLHKQIRKKQILLEKQRNCIEKELALFV